MKFTNQVIEQLPPSQIAFQLQERIEQLETLLTIKEKALKKAPEGSLRVSKSHGAVQYYQKINKDEKNGRYLDSAHRDLAQKLAQKAYNIKVLPAIKKELALLQAALTKIQEATKGGEIPLVALEQINPDCRDLITTATLTDEQYAAAWLSQKYKGKPFQPDAPELYTARGERVRSKSEVIIADTLTRLGIPYHYEFPLTLKSGGRGQSAGTSPQNNSTSQQNEDTSSQNAGARSKITIYPDFLCLNIRTRQEFIWEHFGLMDDADYSAQVARKLNTYNENGIFPGHNLIITVETALLPPNTKHIENLINTFLK